MTDKNNPDISSQLFKDIFENAPFGIYTLDEKGYITSFNPTMLELSGDKLGEALGKNAFELESYKEAGLTEHFRKGLEEGVPFDTEVKYISHVGRKLSIRHYQGIPVHPSDNPDRTWLLLIVEDVTEKRQIEKKLELSLQEERFEHERLRLLINSLGEAVVATSENGYIILYNGAALDLLDTNESIKGRIISDLFTTYTSNEEAIDLLQTVKSLQKPIKRDDILLQVDENDYINLYVNIAPITVSQKTESEKGYIFLLRDITKEKTIEAERDEFISVTSHELRTPIAIAEASVSTAMMPEIIEQTDKVDKMLKKAHQNIAFLGELVANLTTLSRAERGVLEIDIDETDPVRIIKHIETNHRQPAEDKGLVFKTEIDKGVYSITTSQNRVLEILQNLVTNSIKYTPEGTITISVKPSEAYEGGLLFMVSDTGIGISAHDRKKIFDKFYRSEDYRTRETGGTGLGLYVSRRLAERLGGSLDVESKLNQGSVFYLDLPDLKEKEAV